MRFLHPGWPTYRGYRGPFTPFVRRRDDPKTQRSNRRRVGVLSILRRWPTLERSACAGELKTAIRALAERTWRHPVSECNVQFAAATIERWYYIARREEDDPVRALRRAVRKDCGKVSLAPALAKRLHLQYRDHPHWSYQLHYDNLAALVKAEPSLGPLRCYSTVRRYMQARGWPRRPRLGPNRRPGEVRRRETPDARDPQL